MTPASASPPTAPADALVRSLQALSAGAGVGSLRNKTLAQPTPLPPITPRIGTAAADPPEI